jgi:dCTP deaminase
MFLTGKEILAQTKEWEKQCANKTLIDLRDKVKSFETDLKKDAGTPAETVDPDIPSTDLRKNILIYPFPKEAIDRYNPSHGSRVTGIACELTLGEEVFLTSDDAPRRLSDTDSGRTYPMAPAYFTIEPGELAVLTTEEYLYLPSNIVGFISIRNGFKQKGLINVSGFHVDPGFRGKLVFTAYNAGPRDIVLKRGERMFMIFFGEQRFYVKPYWEELVGIPLDLIAGLHGKSVSPISLDERLKRLETIVYVLLVPISAALIVALIRVLW